jgi:uncharacterized membrane protein YoaK (UPF0700 family)
MKPHLAAGALVDESTRRREQTQLSLMLAAIAGFVDAAGYLLLFHLFTAHMSGNSAAMGAFLGQNNWREALHRAFPIPVFVVGVVIGALLTEISLQRNFRSPYALALAVEMVLLALLLLFGGDVHNQNGRQFYALAALPALAMGMQNATLRRVGSLHIRTTYVTGMLTNFAEAGAEYILGAKPRRAMLWQMTLYGGLWVAFAAGAIGGGYAEARWGIHAMIAPLCALALVIAQDWIKPIARHSDVRKHTK